MKKKSKKSLSTAAIVLESLGRRGKEKWRHTTPHDIWKAILRKAEITDALNLGAVIVEVQRVLIDDSFWKAKFLYDFPDLVAFVGTDLPFWIIDGDAQALPEFRDLPWRRYYYVCRRYMRKLSKVVLALGNVMQDDANMMRRMAMYPLRVEGRLLQGSTFMVGVKLFHRPLNLDDREGGEQVGQGETVMTIWEYCQKFVVYDPPEILGPLLDEDIRDEDDDASEGVPVDRGSPHWFRRDLEKNTNIIQIAVMVVARLDAIVHMGFVDEYLKLEDKLGVGPFIAWIVDSVPIVLPNADRSNINQWFQYLEEDDNHDGPLRKLQRIDARNHRMRLVFIFKDSRLYDWPQLLLTQGRQLIKVPGKRGGKARFLIGGETTETGDDHVRLEGEMAGDLERLTLENTAFRHVLVTDARQQLVLMCLTRENSDNEIDMEIHPDNSQFLRVERGQMRVTMGPIGGGGGGDGPPSETKMHQHTVGDGGYVIVPPNTWHRVQNIGQDGEPLKLYTIYSPPHHPPGTHQESKPSETVDGELSPEKAAIMLHEHHFKSDRQRRYFAWRAGGGGGGHHSRHKK